MRSTASRRRNRVWVVEIFFNDLPNKGWQATVGVKLTRDEARQEELNWLRKNEGIKTRVKKYEADNKRK